MAAKRNRKNRNRKRQTRHAAEPGRLLDVARECLDRGDGRAALDALRQARHAEGASDALVVLSFCASRQRARQLADKGMAKEAAAMDARAGQHRDTIRTSSLAAADLARLVRHLDAAEGVRIYASHLGSGGPPEPSVERALADRLVVGGSRECLEALDPGHPLRRDAARVTPGLDAMDAGDWERAARLLQGVPRRSPFAAWRWFCKAMVSFGAGDDRGLLRTIDRLPADFILAGTVAEWRRICAAEGAPPHATAKAGERSSAVRTALGTEGGEVPPLVETFRGALRKGRTRDIERALIPLARALLPEERDPLPARMELLQIVNLAGFRYKLPASVITDLPLRVLPPGRVPGLMARFDLLAQRILRDYWEPAAAVAYLDAGLRADFPRSRERALARGRVLESLARTGRARVDPEFLPVETYEALEELLDRPIEEPETLFADLMSASLAADPDHHEGHRFLLELLRGNRSAKRRLRSALQDMAARFPDDPDPWLELATLHYSRNAYRQAEGALAEARERAPHDERILDLQAVGFLKSADQSRRKGRFALAAQDLERAEALARPLLGLMLPVKRLRLDIADGAADADAGAAPGQLPGLAQRRLAHLPPGTRLRALAVLLGDLRENRSVRNVPGGVEEVAAGLLATNLPLVIGKLGPDEVMELLAPLPDALRLLFDEHRVAPVLAPFWSALMERVDGDRLLTVFDLLLDCEGGRAAVRAEIDRRLQGVAPSRRDPVLLFHLAVIRHQEGRGHSFRRIREVVEAADPAQRERLRAAAARLARHAHGRLRRALQDFDFEPPADFPSRLEDEMPPFPGGEPLYDNLDGPLDDFGAPFDDETLREMMELLEELERRKREAGEDARGGGRPRRPGGRRRGRRGAGDGRGRGRDESGDGGGNAGDPSGGPEEEAPPFEVLLDRILSPVDERDGARRQGALFDDANIAADLARVERRIDGSHLRGAPIALVEEIAGAAEDRPALREELGRLARECDAAGLREGLSVEMRALLFPGERRSEHG